VDNDQFEAAIYPGALRLAGISQVYVVSADKQEHPQLRSSSGFYIDPARERDLLAQNKAVVYDVSHGVRDVTAGDRGTPPTPSDGLPSRVDPGDDAYASQLGSTWYPNEGGYRWMPKRASVVLRGPGGSGEKLYIQGRCPAVVLLSGPLFVEVRIDGERLPRMSVTHPDRDFAFEFALPAKTIGKDAITVEVELSRTIRVPPDTRDLGLIITSFEIR
jgi:hypothetical protein